MLKVIRNFRKLKDADIKSKATHIAQSIADNPSFPKPNPSPEIIQEHITAYRKALAQVNITGAKTDKAKKDEKRRALEDRLYELADYVDLTAKGDEAVLLSSGFDLPKKKEKVGQLPKPENLKIVPIDRGTLKVSVSAIPRARYYEFEIAEMPVNHTATEEPSQKILSWKTYTSSKRQLVVKGLTSGKQYVVRVAAAGSDPNRAWSDEATSFVL